MTLNWAKDSVTVWVNDGTDGEPTDRDNYIFWENERRRGLISKNVVSVKEAESFILHALLFYPEALGTVTFSQGSRFN